MKAYLNLNRVLERTRAEGPGWRFCIWTQGCLQRCVSCCNATMQELRPEILVPVQELCQRLEETCRKFPLEGVTFLGGEPFLQARNLIPVAQCAHSLGMSVMAFSGYELAFLRSGTLPGTAELLEHVDVLVDGPYIQDLPDKKRNWVGSENQKFHYLTSFYDAGIETDERFRGIVEMRFEPLEIAINGCPKTLSETVFHG